MTLLSAFNPHELPEARLRAVETGRTAEVHDIIGTIRENLLGETMQHIIVSAPRGFGKSFLMRHVELECAHIPRTRDRELAAVLMPEEMPHVKEPETLLREIARTFTGGRAQDAELSWHEDDGEAWEAAVKTLDDAVRSKLGRSGLLVALVENFDVLLKRAFPSEEQRLRLRNWLTRGDTRIMLVAASSSGAFDRSYDEPLFHAFKEVALAPWSVDDCLTYFDRQRADAGKPPLGKLPAARARAVAAFIGGTPRLATLLGDALLEDDVLRAADLLDRLTDELTPYYKDRIEALPGRSQKLLDALLRFGEPATQSELARRVNANSQSAIAGPFSDLVRERIVVGESAPNSAGVLYRVADRIFAHYYRRRIVDHGDATCPLEGLVDLLAQYYSRDEKRDRIEQFATLGRYDEARVMARLHDMDAGTGSKSRVWMLRSIGDYLIPSRLLPVASPTLQPVLRNIGLISLGGDGEGALKALNEAARLVWAEPDLVILELVRHRLDAADGVAGGLPVARKAVSMAARVPQLLPLALDCEGWSLGVLRRYDEALAAATRAAALAESTGDRREQAAALRLSAKSLGDLGRHEEALSTATRAATVANAAGDVLEQAIALRHAAFNLGQLGRHEEAVSTATRAATVANAAGDALEQSFALRHAAFSLGELGRHDEAVSTATRAAALAEAAGYVGEQAIALRYAAFNLGQLGRHDEAVSTATRAAAVAEAAGDVGEQACALRYAAFDLFKLGRLDEGFATATRAASLAEAAGDVSGQAIALYYAAVILFDRERYEEALTTASSAAVLAEASGERTAHSVALHIAADALSHLGRFDEAVATSIRAVAVGETTGADHSQWATNRLAHYLVSRGRFSGAIRVWIAAQGSPAADRPSDWHLELTTLARSLSGSSAEDWAVTHEWLSVLTELHEGTPASETAEQLVDSVARCWAEDVTEPDRLTAILNAIEIQGGDRYSHARALLSACRNYHAAGRDPAALAREDPDVAQTIMTMHPPAQPSAKTKGKTIGRSKSRKS